MTDGEYRALFAESARLIAQLAALSEQLHYYTEDLRVEARRREEIREQRPDPA